ncbi:MAG TPA: hypothetical protein VNT03_12765 [Baekduia sp.]|nr:hypothetical protein [Baekduia sp.]
MVVALIALFIALDGPATAARLVDGGSIRKDSITNRQVRNRTLGTQDLSHRAIRSLQTTPSRSVGTKQLRNGAVGTKALAGKAVDASKLADGAVGNTQLAAKAVDAAKMADGGVGSTQLATDAVTSAKIADGAVGAGAIADGGLQTRDLGDFFGSVSVDFEAFAPNSCQVAPVASPQPAAPGQGNVIADDVVSVSPGTNGWPDPIVITGNPGANNTIRIVACRIGGDDGTQIDPPATTFQYVAFDTP